MLLAISLGAGLLAAGLTHQWLAHQRTAPVIASQESIRTHRITQPTVPIHTGLAATLPPDYRAMTIAIDSISGVAGFAQPGDHVDVLATLDTTSGQAMTRTVLQNILLLAIGQNKDMASNSGKAVDLASATLMVSPAQAQVIAMAGAHGHLQLSLCPAQTPQPAHLSAVSLTSLTHVTQQKSPMARPNTHSVRSVARVRPVPQIRLPHLQPLPPLQSMPSLQPAPTVLVVHGTTVQAITVSH